MRKRCEYCDREFNTDQNECPGCGAPLIVVSEAPSGMSSSIPDLEVPTTQSDYTPPPSPPSIEYQTEAPPKTKSKLLIFLVIGVGLIIILGVSIGCLVTMLGGQP